MFLNIFLSFLSVYLTSAIDCNNGCIIYSAKNLHISCGNSDNNSSQYVLISLDSNLSDISNIDKNKYECLDNIVSNTILSNSKTKVSTQYTAYNNNDKTSFNNNNNNNNLSYRLGLDKNVTLWEAIVVAMVMTVIMVIAIKILNAFFRECFRCCCRSCTAEFRLQKRNSVISNSKFKFKYDSKDNSNNNNDDNDDDNDDQLEIDENIFHEDQFFDVHNELSNLQNQCNINIKRENDVSNNIVNNNIIHNGCNNIINNMNKNNNNVDNDDNKDVCNNDENTPLKQQYEVAIDIIPNNEEIIEEISQMIPIDNVYNFINNCNNDNIAYIDHDIDKNCENDVNHINDNIGCNHADNNKNHENKENNNSNQKEEKMLEEIREIKNIRLQSQHKGCEVELSFSQSGLLKTYGKDRL